MAIYQKPHALEDIEKKKETHNKRVHSVYVLFLL